MSSDVVIQRDDSLSLIDKLMDFFPIDKVDKNAGTYDQYLFDLNKAVSDNYERGNYQVAYFYAHLIFMTYVYYCVEKTYCVEPHRLKDVYYSINSYHGRNDKPNLENYKNVYEFSKIPEKDIFKVFHVIGMDDATIKEISNYISNRDDYAHATGKGNISEQAFFQNIKTVIGNMNTLRILFLSNLNSIYINHMQKYLNNDYNIVKDNLNDFVFDNSLSICDIDYLCHLGVKKLQDSNETLKLNYQATRNVHCAFMEYCYNNFGIELPDGYPSLRNEQYLSYRYKNCAKDYVEDELGINEYRCTKEGGEFPVYECLECGEDQLVHDAEKGTYHCFACDENYTEEDLTFCENCGSIMWRNDEPDICCVCLENIMNE